MMNRREKEAVNAYLKLLQNRGAASGTLYKRSLFLDRLTEHLVGKPVTRTSYGHALDKAITTVSLIDKYDCQNTAREFYPFWMNDIKAIAAFDLHFGYDIQSINWRPLPGSLDSITKNLDKENFNEDEAKSLKLYTEDLRRRGAEELVIETRIKLAKIILVCLKSAPANNNKTYRIAVDATLPLFQVKEIKQLFLTVIREFYFFWNRE